MERARCPLPGLAGAALIALLALCLPAVGAESATVDRFIRLSQSFHAQLPRSGLTGLSDSAQRERAVCILSRFEERFGPSGVDALMGLMNVLAKGTQFDDPTVIGFNEQYGGPYDRIVGQCTQRARSS